MLSQSLQQLISDLSKAQVYTGQFEYIQSIKAIARGLGAALVNYTEDSVLTEWDTLYERVVPTNNTLRDTFLSTVMEAWIERWMTVGSEVLKDKEVVVFMPYWVNLSTSAKPELRERLEDVVQWLRAEGVPYLTMKRCRYEVLKEKYANRAQMVYAQQVDFHN